LQFYDRKSKLSLPNFHRQQHRRYVCFSLIPDPFLLFFFSLDFCLWAPPDPDSTIGDTEGEAVAWCTKPGHGSRLFPRGALKGVLFVQTPDYIALSGFVDQAMINIQAGDYGGEMDPHGADLVYTSIFFCRFTPFLLLFYSVGIPWAVWCIPMLSTGIAAAASIKSSNGTSS
jgi:hypothetical protein